LEMHFLFVDGISHGSTKRINPGNRRIVTDRYGPPWGNFRHGYQPSPELLNRLTPERRPIFDRRNYLNENHKSTSEDLICV